MKRMKVMVVLLLVTALSTGVALLAMAGEQKEATVKEYMGQIKSVKVIKCGMEPGLCEGEMVVALRDGSGEVTLAIKPGTWIQRAGKLVLIGELGVGNHVKARAAKLEREPLDWATIIEMTGGE